MVNRDVSLKCFFFLSFSSFMQKMQSVGVGLLGGGGVGGCGYADSPVCPWSHLGAHVRMRVDTAGSRSGVSVILETRGLVPNGSGSVRCYPGAGGGKTAFEPVWNQSDHKAPVRSINKETLWFFSYFETSHMLVLIKTMLITYWLS